MARQVQPQNKMGGGKVAAAQIPDIRIAEVDYFSINSMVHRS